MEACHRGARHWLDRAMGLIHWGMRHWLGRGDGIDSWGLAMGTRGTCWIRAMGLIYGSVQHWLERGDGIDSWGARHGAMRHWLDRGDGINSWGRATLAGSGRWVWLMGVRDIGWTGAMRLIYGGARHWLERGNGIDLGGRVMGVRDWIMEMGFICGGTPLFTTMAMNYTNHECTKTTKVCLPSERFESNMAACQFHKCGRS